MKTKKSKVLWSVAFILTALALVFLFFIISDIFHIFKLPNHFFASYDELTFLSEQSSPFTSANIDSISVGNDKETGRSKIVFRLFGLIPIREIVVKELSDNEVFLGGKPLGFSIKTKGLTVIGSNSILTENGLFSPVASSNIKVGDFIYGVNGTLIRDYDDLQAMLNNSCGSEVVLNVLRGKKEKEVKVKAAKEMSSGNYKLGIWARNDASGIGTLSFATSSLAYGALGHPISDPQSKTNLLVEEGEIYPITIMGIKKGEKGNPGEIQGVFLRGEEIGKLNKNTQVGAFGNLQSENFLDKNRKAVLGGRISVRPGKAKLLSAVSGVQEEYDIEIIKANYQPTQADKSFIFRIKDERLLELTGGIIQGMSGSPVLQNGKLVGAVTHVFINDPTKGFGVYVDWMVDEI